MSAENTEVYRSDATINDENLHQQVCKILAKLRPEWKLQDLKTKKFTEGTVNTLVACYVQDENESVVFRINGIPFIHLIDRQRETDCAQYLSRQHLAPEVEAIFNNGFCYKLFPGKTIGYENLYDEQLYRKIAFRLADFHNSKPPLEDTSAANFFDISKNFPERFPQTKNIPSLPNGSLNKSFVVKEEEFLKKCAAAIGSPIVFCHNDLTPLNILYDNKTDQVVFIDFEFSAYGCQAFDLAFYFCEYCGIQDRKPQSFPDEVHRRKWLTAYAERWAKHNGFVATDVYIEQLCRQVDQFVPIVHFIVALTTVNMSVPEEEKAPGSDYYTKTRFEEYFASKINLP